MIILRDYQETLVDGIRASMRQHRRVLAVSPTGSGKGPCICYMASEAAKRGKRVLIMIHRQELIEQLSRTLTQFDVPHGLIIAGESMPNDQVRIASVQTLGRRIARGIAAGDVDLIIIDEAHHSIAGQWHAVTERYPNARIIGYTATPERLDGRGLKDAFDDLVLGPSVKSLIDRGFLASYVAFSHPSTPDMRGAKTIAGDYSRADIELMMDQAPLLGDAVKHYRKHASGIPAVAFCSSVLHAKHVADMFHTAGYRAASVDGAMDPATRKWMINGLRTGEIQVLASCDLISEGLDVEGIGAAILMRPTKSLGLYMQQVGRALRPKSDGSRAIILDHAGNIHQHGMPDMDREWSLEGRKKRDKSPGTKTCPECFAICEADETECPECGARFGGGRRKGKGKQAEDGELVEVTDIKPKLTQAAIGMELRMCKTFTDLTNLAKKAGYKPGWAFYQAQSRGIPVPRRRRAS